MTKKNRNWAMTARPQAVSARPRITLAMIVKNEEEFIAGCLESAKGCVDEIVVVDTGSTDKTKEIAAGFGAKVFDHEWKNDFAEARNVSIQHSTGDWILWLDADECLAEGSDETIRKAVKRQDIGGYIVTIRNYQDRQGRHVLVHEMCRLFRKVPGLKFEQRIHEQMVDHIIKLGYKLASADIVINHFGYIPEIFNQRDKKRRNSELLRIELEENPDNLWLLYKKASTHGAAAGYHEAIELYERIEQSGGAQGIGVQLYYEWADCLTGANRAEEAVEICEKATKIGFKHPELHYVWARALLALDRLDDAAEHFELAIKLGEEMPGATGDEATWGFGAYDGLAKSHGRMENWEKVIEYTGKALSLKADDIEALSLRARASRALGDSETTRTALEHILAADPNEPNAHSDLARLAVESEDFPTARYHLEKLSKLEPNRFEVHQQLAGVYEELSMPDQAMQCYKRVLELQPRSLYALNNLARILAARQEYQQALDCISSAIAIDPHWANAYFNAADILYKVGAIEDAKAAYEKALQLDPGNASGFFMLGNCYFKQGAYRAAEMAYCQALSIRADYPEAENNLALAHSYKEQGTQVEALPRAA